MFWFKPTKIVVDCFTYHHSIFDFYRPVKASNFIPDGWKALPKKVDLRCFPNNPESKMYVDGATAKTCVGFINLYRSGFILQNAVELNLEITKEGNLNAHSTDPMRPMQVSQHDTYQVWDTFYKDYAHIKLTPPWSIVEKTGVNFMFTKCTWNDTHMADNFHVLNGILDYKIQHNCAVNFYAKKESIVKLYAGQPLAHIIPLSEKKIELRYHLISSEEYMHRFGFVPANRLYPEFERVKKQCPFGFGK